ncbi:MAG TPA: hypothetical protein VGH80_09380 [Xanthomonadaceae bacterium]|jgi:hypothetical protein
MLMQSAVGFGRYFTCQSCSRHLSVSGGWKAAYATVLVVAMLSCYFASHRVHSWTPYLGLPLAIALMSLLVRRRAAVRFAGRSFSLVSLLNLGMLGMAFVAADYATSM